MTKAYFNELKEWLLSDEFMQSVDKARHEQVSLLMAYYNHVSQDRILDLCRTGK